MLNDNEGAVYWQSPVRERDDFDFYVGDEFIDGKTIYGPWAIMTPHSFANHGVGLGTGKGQRYRKQSDGRFLKVAG